MFLKRAISTTALTHLSLVLALASMPAVVAHANPEGGVVVGGSADIVSNGAKLDIHQHTESAVIDWRSFNIEPNEHTQFYQPSSSALALNRVNSPDPSYILGRLSANGNIILINPNGVFFGAGSRVDVNGLVASTADTTNDNFMAGAMKFDIAGNQNAAIINEGHITAGEEGLVGFVAPYVANHGVIEAKMGRVHLAGGDTATVDLYGDGLMEVAVEGDGHAQAVINTGAIVAEGGTIAMTASSGRNIVDNLIVAKGELKAPSLGTKNGKITIFAEGSNAVKANAAADKGIKAGKSAVVVQASLDVSGRREGERGGNIEILGDDIAILNGAIMDASGHTGATNTVDGKKISAARDGSAGGDIKIGGDYLGQGNTATAENLFVDTYTLFYNDAIQHGDAGRTIFWSDADTVFKGNVYARGGMNGGNGGFVETSGKNNLLAQGYVDLSATNGKKGSYFLDPSNITIYGNVDPTFVSTDGTLNLGANLQAWYDASSVTGVADGAGLHQWNDLSGRGNHAVAFATDPIYQSNGGNPYIQFTSGHGYATSGLLGITGNENRTVAAIFSSGGGNNNMVGFGVDGGGAINDLMTYGGGIIGHFYGGGYDTIGGSPSYTLNALTSAMMTYNGTHVSVYKNGSLGNTTAMNLNTADSTLKIGSGTYAPFNGYSGRLSEVAVYDTNLTGNSADIFSQYQSAKWGLALTPPGTGATEAQKAMAADGYSAFTTRYLERLSQSADISLLATNNITLDLKGDTLALSNDRNITLTTTNGNITDVSAGTIRTNRTGSGGHITMTAGGAGNITLDTTNLEALNGGKVSLMAGGNISLQQASLLTLDGAVGNNLSLQATAGITGNGMIRARSGTINLSSTNDVDLRNAAMKTTNQAISVSGRDVLLSTAVQTGTGQVSVTASRDVSVHAPTPNGNLTAFWDFNEGAGTNLNDSVGNYDGAVIGPAWSSNTFDGTGHSLVLDGVDDYINLPFTGTYSVAGNMGLAYNANWSVSMWYKGTDTAQNGDWGKGLLGWDNTGLWAGLVLRNGYAEYVHYNAGWEHDIKSSTMVADGNWHQITYVNHANGTGDLYIDGVREISGIGSSFAGPGVYYQPREIGANYNHAYTSGQFDNVRIYQSALTSGQAAQLDTSWKSGSVLLNAGRDVTLNSGISANGTGDAIIASSGRNFINNAGTNALQAANGRYMVYSTNPGQNNLGGLVYGTDYAFRRFGCTYGSGCAAGTTVPSTGNGFFYSDVPTLTVTPDAIANRIYGDSAPSLTGYSYTITGWLDALDNINGGITGALNGVTTYTSNSNAGTTHAINYGSGTLTSATGYNFTYANNANAFGVNKASVQVAADNATMTQGASPTIHFIYTGFKNGQIFDTSGATGMPSLLVNPSARSAGSYAMDLDLSGLSATNYIFSEHMTKGQLTVNAPPASNILPPSVQQIIAQPPATTPTPSSSPSSTTSSSQSSQSTSSKTTEDDKNKNVNSASASKPDPVVSAMVADGLLEIAPEVKAQFSLCTSATDGSCGAAE